MEPVPTPGVYIDEVPSGVRTITGVATSIAAFLGRARRGPIDEPVVINSFGDFERRFGGLWSESTLGHAVRDFYLNGGARAVVVRLARDAETATLSRGQLDLEAVSPGSWADALRVRVDHEVSAEAAARPGVNQNQLFNLAVHDAGTGDTEEYRSVTMVDGPRRADVIVNRESDLVTVRLTGNTRPTAHGDPDPGRTVWEDEDASTGVATADQGDDGEDLTPGVFTGASTRPNKQGLYALEKADLFNLLCVPPYRADGSVDGSVIVEAARYCEERRAFLILDPPPGWTDKDAVVADLPSFADPIAAKKNAAVFFPRLRGPDPKRDGEVVDRAPSGAVAGVFARTDVVGGVWKAPAGLEATLAGVLAPSVPLTDPDNGELNRLGVNCLRSKPPAGVVVWGSRTLEGDDRLASEWKYIPARRLALFLEESLYRGTQWVVFEPNDESLWAQIRLSVSAFMQNLFRQGAFQGSTPRDAYFVKCDSETTTQNDIDLGIVNILVGFAPLKPAELVILKIQQKAGQIET